MSVWGSGGRIELTVAKFMALQRTVQPDWYQSMADGETWQSNTSRKRVRKSVDRTLSHLDECLLAHQNSKVHTHIQNSLTIHSSPLTFYSSENSVMHGMGKRDKDGGSVILFTPGLGTNGEKLM